jgi:hypothetical protein
VTQAGGATERDVQLACLQGANGASEAAAIPPAKLHPGRCLPRGFENAPSSQPTVAQEVDDQRPRRDPQLSHGEIVQREDVACAAEQALARWGQCHAPRGSREQCDAELALQALDLAAQHLLRDEEPRGGAREVELFGGGDEIAQRT